MTRLLLFDTTTERTYPLEVPDEFWSPDSPVDRYVFLKNIGEAYVLKPIESAAEQQLKQLTDQLLESVYQRCQQEYADPQQWASPSPELLQTLHQWLQETLQQPSYQPVLTRYQSQLDYWLDQLLTQLLILVGERMGEEIYTHKAQQRQLAPVWITDQLLRLQELLTQTTSETKLFDLEQQLQQWRQLAMIDQRPMVGRWLIGIALRPFITTLSQLKAEVAAMKSISGEPESLMRQERNYPLGTADLRGKLLQSVSQALADARLTFPYTAKEYRQHLIADLQKVLELYTKALEKKSGKHDAELLDQLALDLEQLCLGFVNQRPKDATKADDELISAMSIYPLLHPVEEQQARKEWQRELYLQTVILLRTLGVETPAEK